MKFQDKCFFALDGTKLTFNDIALKITQPSSIKSRTQVDLSVRCKDLLLHLPVIGANMSSVMDANSAKYLALMGGIGVLHQNVSIQQQIGQIDNVKRFATPIVHHPYCLDTKATIQDVQELFQKQNVGAVMILDSYKSQKVKGILTKRDLYASESSSENVQKYMTHLQNLIYIQSNNPNVDIAEGEQKLKQSRYEQLPIINKQGKLIGLFTRKGLKLMNQFHNSARDSQRRLVVAAAVGQNRQPLQRAEQLIKAGLDLLVIDTAHGRNNRFLDVIKEIRHSFPDILICAGNIDAPDAALDFARLGVDIIKVGIGPGGACKTRTQTGYGTPQISAIGEIKQALVENGFENTNIIGDGGIRTSGDLAKTIAAGANYGMIGSILAGTDMAPGQLRYINGLAYKDYRGMASYEESKIAKSLNGNNEDYEYGPIFDEGGNDIVPYKGDGSFLNVLRQLQGGLASALSYTNAQNLEEFYDKSRFVLQTMNGYMEGTPHAFGK